MAQRRPNKKQTTAKDKLTYSTSQLLNFAPNSYLERTSRPIYAIIFLLPFILFYEIGTILINTDMLNRSQIRVVAFVWLQNLLEQLGTSSRVAWVAPPFVVVLILLGLQVASRKKWRFGLIDLLPMTVECILLAIPLIVFTLFLSSPPKQNAHTVRSAIPVVAAVNQPSPHPYEPNIDIPAPQNKNFRYVGQPLPARIITGIGAGIYEELVFRLILICLLMMFFQDLLRLSHKSAIILSVLISAALFSAHHHVGIQNGLIIRTEAFDAIKFSFRTLAGIYFAGLFAIRGFGITAGTHAFYDILAAIINTLFFQE